MTRTGNRGEGRPILITGYDAAMGSLSVIPQSLGRVVVNLIANAIDAISEKTLSLPDFLPANPGSSQALGRLWGNHDQKG